MMTQNASLANRVQTLLPAGAGLASASAGFEDTATFLAAAHLAHNLNIPWESLKAETTGKHRRSFARAIAQFRPDLDFASIRNSVKLAEREAAWDCNRAASSGARDRTAARIAANGDLAARVQAILPASVTVASAAAGFASEQEFLTAAELSNMLQIDFPDLKDRLMAGQSLREAARQMKPEMSSESLDAGMKTAAVRGRDLRVESSASASASVRTVR
ncbi:MAG TPA: hypothetical protein VHB50_23870 [Bryobacteraceae bacterium]|nr:hypothetical protein [Bryobacteraceae bacterium]